MKLSTRITRARENLTQFTASARSLRAQEGTWPLAKAMTGVVRAEVSGRVLLPLATKLHPSPNLVLYLTNFHGDGPGRQALLGTDLHDQDLLDLATNILSKLGANPGSGVGLVNLADPSTGGDLDTLLSAVFASQEGQEAAREANEGQDTAQEAPGPQEPAQSPFGRGYGSGGGSQN